MGADSILGLSEITENKAIWRMLVAEFIGTFLLVVIGCGSIVLPGEVIIVRIALTFGITVATLAQSIGHVSGCHINPAVTLSLFATGDIKLLRALLFIAVQLIGAVGGSAVLRLMVPEDKEKNLGITNINVQDGVTDVQGFLMEVILTFLLLFIIHAVCDPRRKDIKGSAPLAIGLAVTACHLCGIPYSGSSLNPARSFGPAVIMDSWENHWVYWAGPLVGGVLAGLIYKYLFKTKKSDVDSYDF
ncbi:aquaporin AQPAe.a isoform X2 [Tribolium madens]|uniref:aquaporin AQPAe.a isoform X2 n=1 Tax=Tribolium madens TaxID=41895 RepID=UPI001CF73D0E|nr:aquaporin AQPAe.a isoform X2 [Tribolium madens]